MSRHNNFEMITNMNDSRIVSIKQLNTIINSLEDINFKFKDRDETYKWIKLKLKIFNYRNISKKNKGIVLRYIQKVTGLSHDRVKKLAVKYLKGKLRVNKYVRVSSFKKKYLTEDILLLIHTDNIHSHLNGHAIKTILKDEFELYGNNEYENISKISVSHIYNIRTSIFYQRRSRIYSSTKSTTVKIGERKPLSSNTLPGYLNVDTVHQGDRNGEKGVYHVNIVDSATQFEFIASVPIISERYLEPILKALINSFPFTIYEFHSDNGSEYVNHVVSKLLNKLYISQLKSRPRKCNDNAQVETKNGSIIRKHIGYLHIPKEYAKDVNIFYSEIFNEYLNYHRPCGFAFKTIDEKGKERKKYKEYCTPYQKLKRIDPQGKYLKRGKTYEYLDKIERRMTHNQYASIMEEEKVKLFRKVLEL